MDIKIIDGKPTRLLGNVVKTNGKVFNRIEEGEDYYVYCEGEDGEYGNFEVILKTYRPKSVFDNNKEYTNVEHYPATSEWGKIAWTYTQKKTLKKFLERKPWRNS